MPLSRRHGWRSLFLFRILVVDGRIKLEWTPLRRQEYFGPAYQTQATAGLSRRGIIASRYRQVFTQFHTVGGARPLWPPRGGGVVFPESFKSTNAGLCDKVSDDNGKREESFVAPFLSLNWCCSGSQIQRGWRSCLVKFRGRYCLVLACISSPDDVAPNAGKLKTPQTRGQQHPPATTIHPILQPSNLPNWEKDAVCRECNNTAEIEATGEGAA